jgi:hypothetical protein
VPSIERQIESAKLCPASFVVIGRNDRRRDGRMAA